MVPVTYSELSMLALYFFLGVSDVKLPACTTVSEGHKISLTVKCDLDAELDNKVKSFIYNTCLNVFNLILVNV